MRQYLLAALIAAAGLAVGAAVVVLDRRAPLPVAASAAPSPVASEPVGGEATATLPLPAPEQPATPETAPAPPPATADATPPAKPPGSDLPNVDVAPRVVHSVPDAEPPSAPSVTVVDRNGRTLKELKPSAGLSPTYVPSVGPGGAGASVASRGSPRPVLPPAPNSRLASVPPGATVDGRGSAAGGTTLSVAGRSMRLFG